tara:strand:+ start:1266 stop:1478 length:213 start_codon:yes stop_codon:yes gene_type:complete
MEDRIVDKEVEEAIEKLSIILEEVNNLMDAVKHDINLLSLSVEELETIFQKDEDFGPTGAYVNQDPDLKN